MADLKKLTPISDIYLENTSTRNAFYHVKVYEVGSKFEVAVTYGPIGTNGRTLANGKFMTLVGANMKMNNLARKKENQSYCRAKIRGKATERTRVSKQKGIIKSKALSLSRFSQILE